MGERVRSTLAKITLKWMIEEARREKFGLKIDAKRYNRYILGLDTDGQYVGPDHTAKSHESLKGPWWTVQFLPQRLWEPLERRKVFRFPQQQRPIEENSTLHDSVLSRIEAGQYKPANLSAEHQDLFPQMETIRTRFKIFGSTEASHP